jgi:methyl-accepting chemotaxis protein
MRQENHSLTVVPPLGRPAQSGLPIGFKLLAGIGIVFAMLASAIVGAVFSLLTVTRNQAELQERNVPYAVAISTAALNAKGIANDERGFLISGDPEFVEEIEQRLLNARTAFAAAAIAADGDVQSRAVDEAQTGFERWVWALERELATFRAGDREAARKAALGPGRALRKKYEASLAEAQSVAKIAIHQQRNSLASSGWAIILLASLLVVLMVGSVVSFWLLRALDAAANAGRTAEPAPVGLALREQQVDRPQHRNG